MNIFLTGCTKVQYDESNYKCFNKNTRLMIFHSLLPLQGRYVSPQETNSVIGGPQFGPQGGGELNIL